MRIDVYLKLMGIFKTRSVAGKACKGGYVTTGDIAVKSSRFVNKGDLFEIVNPDGSKISVEVLEVPRGSQVSRKDRQNYFRIVGMEG
ncbi:MAG: hypothetical protein K8S15_11015 [Candidatus Aegiribacteria sp.]|nr:hypothetical protein [Candidatus Aegiribacteria sp.]